MPCGLGSPSLREVEKILEKGSVLGYTPVSLVVPAGPFMLRDDQLMSVASTMMLRLLDTGKNKPCVQYNTVRPMRSAVPNQWRLSSLDGQTALVMMRGTTKLITSTCPTNGKWYERFMLGFHKRVGHVSQPDLAILIEVVVALMARFERLWILADGDGPSQEKVLFPALFAILTYARCLLGEETPLMDLHATHYKDGINHPKHAHHVVMTLRGRFKTRSASISSL